MSTRTRFLIGAVAAVLVAGMAAAGGGTFWLKGQLQSPEYCANCHAVAPHYESWKSSPFLAHTHAKVGLTCQNCHTRTLQDGMREVVSTLFRTYELPLEDHPLQQADCLKCHGSYEVLASQTEDLKGPDGFALGRNPHDSHWGPLECGICHKMHKPSVDFCSKCHQSPMQGPAWEAMEKAAPFSEARR